MISKTEFDQEILRIRLKCNSKICDALSGRKKAYREAFWNGYEIARDAKDEELQFALSLALGGTKDDSLKVS